MRADVGTRPVGPDDVPDLARLFAGQRNTRRCWCMAFCLSRSQFALGWLGGGNRRRFEELASTSSAPMGVLAEQDGEPVGWCACGPRIRYAAATDSSGALLTRRLREEDRTVWLLPCVYVAAGSRGQGVSHALLRGAVEQARSHDAAAIEGWPLASTEARSADAFVGREQVFEELGFVCVARPSPVRAIMRLELRP